MGLWSVIIGVLAMHWSRQWKILWQRCGNLSLLSHKMMKSDKSYSSSN